MLENYYQQYEILIDVLDLKGGFSDMFEIELHREAHALIDHWFWRYALANKGVYFQAGIATLMVNFALVIGFGDGCV